MNHCVNSMMDQERGNAESAINNESQDESMEIDSAPDATNGNIGGLSGFVEDAPPTPPYTLWTTDGRTVCIGKELWEESRVLMRSCPLGEKKYFYATAQTVNALVRLNQTGIFPDNMTDLLDVFCLARSLQLRRCLRLCFDFYLTGEVLCGGIKTKVSECLFPPDCSPWSVLNLWEMLLESPPRKIGTYADYMRKLSHFSLEFDFQTEVRYLISRMNARRNVKDESLALSLDLKESSMTVAIVFDKGFVRLALLKSGVLEAIEIPSMRYSRWFHGVITDFYLVYDKYVIFRSPKQDVFLKDLRVEEKPFRLCGNILQFVAKNEHLFLLQKGTESKPFKILKWTGREMHQLETTHRVGNRCDFCPNFKRLCYVSETLDFVSVEALWNYILTPVFKIRLAEQLDNFALFNTSLYLFLCDNQKRFETSCFNSKGEEEIVDAQIRNIDGSVSDLRAEGSQLLLKLRNAWHVYTEGRLQELPKTLIFEAINGVSMNPYILGSEPL